MAGIRSIAGFVIVGFALLASAVVATVYVWSLVQGNYTQSSTVPTTTELDVSSSEVTAEDSETDTTTVTGNDTRTEQLEHANAIESAPTIEIIEPVDEITVDTSQLTDEQRAAAEQFGISVDDITVTEDMRLCAVAAVGEERLAELVAGETPGIFEGLSLLGCFKNN